MGHLDVLNDILQKKKRVPICLEIHPTNFCNCECSGCVSHGFRQKNPWGEVNSNALKEFLTCYKARQGEAVLWSGGGEPTAYQCKETGAEFLDLLRDAAALGLEQGLYTNGTLLNDTLSAYLLDSLQFVRVSLDAFTASTYEATHGRDFYPLIAKNLANLLAYKRRSGSVTTIGVSFTLRDQNLADLADSTVIKEWVSQFPVDYVFFKPLICPDGKNIRGEAFQKAYEQVQEMQSEIQGKTKIILSSAAFAESRGTEDQCYYHYFNMCVGPDETIYHCCHHEGERQFVVGRLQNPDAFFKYLTEKYSGAFRCACCPESCRARDINELIAELSRMEKSLHKNFI